MTASRRIIINSGLLYGKTVITIFVAFFTTRIVIKELGVNDYGIFALVAGIVSMLAFFNAALTTSTQRFLSFNNTSCDNNRISDYFWNGLYLHIIISIIAIILFEIVYLVLFNGFINIDTERIGAAKIVFQTVMLSVVATIVVVPFKSLLTAKEDFSTIVVINIIESVLRLMVALGLGFVSIDKLIVYAILICFVTIGINVGFVVISSLKYSDIVRSLDRKIDKSLMIEMSSFAGWNLFGILSWFGRTQGLAVILNLWFGTAINAAYGVSNQVSGQMNLLSATLLRAINPQLMKSEGEGKRERMVVLSIIASKSGFLLVALLAIPSIFEIKELLQIWLKTVPSYTVEFLRLTLVIMMVTQLTSGIQSAIQAIGSIKVYQISIGGLILLNIPVAVLLIYLGYPPQSVLFSYLIIESIAMVLRMYFLKYYAGVPLQSYITKVFGRVILPIIVSIITCYLIVNLIEIKFRFILTFVVNTIFSFLAIYLFTLTKSERAKVKSFIIRYSK